MVRTFVAAAAAARRAFATRRLVISVLLLWCFVIMDAALHQPSSLDASSERRKQSNLSSRSKMQRLTNDSHGGRGITYMPAQYDAVVIFLHGLGDTASGWEDLPRMVASEQPQLASRTKFILPTADTVPITLNMGYPMTAWADIIAISPDAPEDVNGYRRSFERVKRIITEEVTGPSKVDPHRIILGGFSLGGALTYYTIFHQDLPFDLGGAITLSSWAPKCAQKDKRPVPRNWRLFHGHGSADNLVSYEWGKMSQEWAAKTAGIDVVFETYPNMEHSACLSELQDVIEYIAGRLGAE